MWDTVILHSRLPYFYQQGQEFPDKTISPQTSKRLQVDGNNNMAEGEKKRKGKYQKSRVWRS
ncbi:Hypothetical protein EAG7_05060 [Klebsiella aerogenes]|nr:Hypothetical protein EAG7_05060 [Klebsiella aerogenes]CCG33555.1 hypothetical protein [Klebsiella aerogenes EA1509E]